MWHRGDRAKARDLYDWCAVAAAEPEAIRVAEPFMRRHGAAFLAQLHERAEFLKTDFEAIDAIGPHLSFESCVRLAQRIVEPALARND